MMQIRPCDRILPHLISILLVSIILFVQGNRAVEAATGYAGDFLRLGAGARALALGSAYVALAEDATGGYYNPAGLFQLKSAQILGQHSERFAGVVKNDFIAAVIPGKAGQSFGLSLLRVGIDDIKYTKLKDNTKPLDLSQNRPYVSKRVSAADWALYLSVGHRLWPKLSTGTSLKLIVRRLGDNSAFGYGVDLGFLYHPLPALSLGIKFSDLFCTPVRWDTGRTDAIMPSVQAGLACSWPVSLFHGRFTGTFELTAEKDAGSYEVHFSSGGEYRFHNLLALRLGSKEGELTAGAGLRIYNRANIDFAFLQQEENTYRVSITYDFNHTPIASR